MPEETTQRQRLVIDREEWLRGDELGAELLNDAGQRCCVGIYLKACGVSDTVLFEVPDVRALVGERGPGVLPAPARWLYNDVDGDVPCKVNLYADNDSDIISETEREGAVAGTFARFGVDVTFIN